jgi:hypothetical protein
LKERGTSYRHVYRDILKEGKVDFSNFIGRVRLRNIFYFEFGNNISINVFEYNEDEDDLFLIYKSSIVSDKQVYLVFIPEIINGEQEGHYCLRGGITKQCLLVFTASTVVEMDTRDTKGCVYLLTKKG